MEFVICLVLLTTASGWVSVVLGDDAKLAKEYVINLDLPPAAHWAEVARAHGDGIKILSKVIKKHVPQVLADAVSVVSEGMFVDNLAENFNAVSVSTSNFSPMRGRWEVKVYDIFTAFEIPTISSF